MKQFLVVLKFELSNYFRKKSFLLSTLIITLVIVGGICLPNFIDISPILPGVKNETNVEQTTSQEQVNFGIYDKENIIPNKEILKTYFPNSSWEVVNSQEKLKQLVEDEKIQAGFDIKSLTKYTYLVENTKFDDTNKAMFDEVLKTIYRQTQITNQGIDFNKVDNIYNTQVVSEVEVLGKDGVNNYFYGYILIFVIYMMILSYGQLIAVAITTEKSNRAIEVLVTSTNTNNLIFGKVIAGAIATIVQVGVIMSAGIITYKINSEAWNNILDSIFKIPMDLIVTFAIFGILGYLFYSFIFASLGALVSKTEEISTSIGPVMMIFIVAFLISVFGLSKGDSTLIKVCSYIPFASPMTMIVRVASGDITSIEFIISALILAISTILVGIGASKIYKMATLMYGNPIKLKNAFKLLKSQK